MKIYQDLSTSLINRNSRKTGIEEKIDTKVFGDYVT